MNLPLSSTSLHGLKESVLPARVAGFDITGTNQTSFGTLRLSGGEGLETSGGSIHDNKIFLNSTKSAVPTLITHGLKIILIKHD